MRRPTYKELSDSLMTALTALNSTTSALQYLADGTAPSAIERIKVKGGDCYTVRLYVQLRNGILRADGGLLIITQHIVGQDDATNVQTLESWARYQQQDLSGLQEYLPFRIAADRLLAARDRIFAEKEL